MDELTLNQSPFRKKIYWKYGSMCFGGLFVMPLLMVATYLLQGEDIYWPAVGMGFLMMLLMTPVFCAKGAQLELIDAQTRVVPDMKKQLLESVREAYGVELQPGSVESLLRPVKFHADGTLQLPKSGGVLRLGSAMQMDDRQYLNVQLVWDGKKFMLANLEEGPDSMVELVSRKEDVPF